MGYSHLIPECLGLESCLHPERQQLIQDQVVGSLLPIWDTELLSLFIALTWSSTGCSRHLGSESALSLSKYTPVTKKDSNKSLNPSSSILSHAGEVYDF